MAEAARQRIYRVAADERAELDVLEAVAEDVRQRIEMRLRTQHKPLLAAGGGTGKCWPKLP